MPFSISVTFRFLMYFIKLRELNKVICIKYLEHCLAYYKARLLCANFLNYHSHYHNLPCSRWPLLLSQKWVKHCPAQVPNPREFMLSFLIYPVAYPAHPPLGLRRRVRDSHPRNTFSWRNGDPLGHLPDKCLHKPPLHILTILNILD